MEAFYSYRDEAAPFARVRGLLAKRLCKLSSLAKMNRRNAPSTDFFGRRGRWAQWRKRAGSE